MFGNRNRNLSFVLCGMTLVTSGVTVLRFSRHVTPTLFEWTFFGICTGLGLLALLLAVVFRD